MNFWPADQRDLSIVESFINIIDDDLYYDDQIFEVPTDIWPDSNGFSEEVNRTLGHHLTDDVRPHRIRVRNKDMFRIYWRVRLMLIRNERG